MTLRTIHRAHKGRLTPEYLAQLAVTFEEISKVRRDVIPAIATAIDGNPATVKVHVVKAREEGYLTPTTPGKGGGEATERARETLLNVARSSLKDDA